MEFELHFCVLIVAHFCIPVENLQMVYKTLCEPPLKMMNKGWQRKILHRLLRRRCTRQVAHIAFRFRQGHLMWCFVFIRIGILHGYVDKNCKKFDSLWSEIPRIHPTIEWPFIVPLSWNGILIFSVSQYQWETCQPPSMYPPCCWSSLWSVSFHKGL